MRPSYLPVQYEHCPYCGSVLNIWGQCMDCISMMTRPNTGGTNEQSQAAWDAF